MPSHICRMWSRASRRHAIACPGRKDPLLLFLRGKTDGKRAARTPVLCGERQVFGDGVKRRYRCFSVSYPASLQFCRTTPAIHRLSTSARLQTRQRAWALSHSHPPFRAAISPGKFPASCKTSICLRNFWAYVDRMDWQQPASLLVVFIAFILMVRGLFGRRVSCASGAGCCGSGSGKGVFPRSTTFRARKGQRPEMVIKR